MLVAAQRQHRGNVERAGLPSRRSQSRPADEWMPLLGQFAQLSRRGQRRDDRRVLRPAGHAAALPGLRRSSRPGGRTSSSARAGSSPPRSSPSCMNPGRARRARARRGRGVDDPPSPRRRWTTRVPMPACRPIPPATDCATRRTSRWSPRRWTTPRTDAATDAALRARPLRGRRGGHPLRRRQRCRCRLVAGQRRSARLPHVRLGHRGRAHAVLPGPVPRGDRGARAAAGPHPRHDRRRAATRRARPAAGQRPRRALGAAGRRRGRTRPRSSATAATARPSARCAMACRSSFCRCSAPISGPTRPRSPVSALASPSTPSATRVASSAFPAPPRWRRSARRCSAC